MKDVEIIRLNIERYRRMLRGELDSATRRAIETMLWEFEAKLSVEGSHAPSGQSAIVTEVPMSGSNQPARTSDQQGNSGAMSDRATTKLFAWSLGGILFAALALNAAFR